MRQSNERDRVRSRDLDVLAVEARRFRPVDQLLELHEEVTNPRRERHARSLAAPGADAEARTLLRPVVEMEGRSSKPHEQASDIVIGRNSNAVDLRPRR